MTFLKEPVIIMVINYLGGNIVGNLNENIIQITGKVKYSITLDPGFWIFDDRKLDLTTYFDSMCDTKTDEIADYRKLVSGQWDKEITEGASVPTPVTTNRQSEKEKLSSGTFGIVLKPFLKNSEPLETAKSFVIEMAHQEEVEIPLDEAYNLILGFYKDGKSLREDGPVHIYYGDGSNQQSPLKNIRGFRIE